MKRFLSIALALVVAVIAYAGEIATAVFTVSPRMHCENCEKKIKENVRYAKGVKEIATSRSNQTVTIKYDPAKASIESLTQAFGKIGYKATIASTTTAKPATTAKPVKTEAPVKATETPVKATPVKEMKATGAEPKKIEGKKIEGKAQECNGQGCGGCGGTECKDAKAKQPEMKEVKPVKTKAETKKVKADGAE